VHCIRNDKQVIANIMNKGRSYIKGVKERDGEKEGKKERKIDYTMTNCLNFDNIQQIACLCVTAHDNETKGTKIMRQYSANWAWCNLVDQIIGY